MRSKNNLTRFLPGTLQNNLPPFLIVMLLAQTILSAPLSAQIVQADNLSSPNYRIQMGNFNITSGEKTGGGYSVTDTVGQNAPGQYGQIGEPFRVFAGFQYLQALGKFSFRITSTADETRPITWIDFGTLTPGTFANASFRLFISARGAGGYSVTAYQTNPLTNPQNGATIDSGDCDGGCSYETAAAWTSPANPGFGYRMSGTDVPSVFTSNPSYYKTFADISLDQPPQIVMSNAGVVKNHEATVTLQTAISGSQAAGTYENQLVFIATPGY